MSDALQMATYAYLAMFVCVLVAEFGRRKKTSVISGLTAVVLASIGGTAWCYDALYARSDLPLWASLKKHSPGSGQHRSRAGVVADASDEEGDAGEDGGDTTKGGMPDSDDSSISSAVTLALDDSARNFADKVARKLGIATEPAPGLIAGDSITDCPDCPELVVIPAGSQVLGANEHDAAASEAEKPERLVRFWPGFAIARQAISAQSFAHFLRDTGRSAPVCSAAAVAAPVGGRAASRLSADDAETYVVWLSGRTGKPFRLPSADEWEYAAKAAGNMQLETPVAALADLAARDALRLGEVSEVVSDCWLDRATIGPYRCDARMLKGSAPQEDVKWRRLSAKRKLPNAAVLPTVGFRVVRSLK